MIRIVSLMALVRSGRMSRRLRRSVQIQVTSEVVVHRRPDEQLEVFGTVLYGTLSSLRL